MRIAPLVIVSAALAGCAARGPSPELVADRGRADALVREGCYTCLQEALEIYERLAALPSPVPMAGAGAFNAALLIAVREKELGIPAEAAFERARQAAAAIPAAIAPAISPGALLTAAGLVIGETSGLDPAQREQLAGRNRQALDSDDPRRRGLDAHVDANLAAAYVALALDCEQARWRDAVDVAVLVEKYAAVPLMQFRVATCPRPAAPPAGALREANLRWADTLPWEGRRELAGSQATGIDLHKAAALFAEARAAFPASTAVTMAWAHASQSLAEHEAALSGFDAVLAAQPAHRDAMLGRTTSLSYLMRHSEAIASATRLIDLGTWHIGDAFYWRAWNHYNLSALRAAWDDVEQAMTRLSNSSVYMLAGLIEYGRTNLPVAVQRFDRSHELDPSNCDAVWMSGLVHVDRQAWAEASPRFSTAMSCFVSAAERARNDLARLESSPRPETQKLRPRDTLQKQIVTSDERAAQSAFNAAQGYARLGEKSRALTHAGFAARHPRMREKAIALKAAIEKMP
jgi:tetratricopeptide (TPR) repeat protein